MPLSNDRASWLEETEDRSVRVELNLSLIDRLASEVLRGFGAAPRGGVEIGGILLGRRDGERVVITDYEPLASDYSQGPTYVPTGAERERFLAATRNRAAVAMFRSHTGAELQPSEHDLELLREAGLALLLLAKPAALTASSAALYRIEGCETKPIGTCFPLRARQLTGGAAPERARRRESYETNPAPPAPPPEPEIPPPAFLSTPAAKRSHTPGRALTGLGLLAVFTVGAALGWYAASRPAAEVNAAQPAHPFRLRLNAERSGDGVLVRWDRGAEAVRQGSRAVLTIREGAGSQTVDLDLKQLRSGNVLYRHVPAEVAFLLEVHVEGSRVAEEFVWRNGQADNPAATQP